MEKSLNGKKLLSLTKGLAGFAGILLVLFVIFSCNNILITSGGSLIISTPGARAASDSISYTIVVEGSKGSTQSKPLTGGTTVQFDDLAPDTYTISVEGRNEDDAVVLYGTDSATVEAGKTASADVELKKGASDFASLESAIAAGGTVYIFESIDVENGLTVGTTVEILPAYQDVTLTNKSSENLFTVDTNGNLTIGGGEYTITLDGNAGSHHAIYMKNTGKATLSRNAVITNCGTAGVKFNNYQTTAYFYLEGGSIMGNNGSGVEINYGSEFHMNSGIIEKNKATNGGGVYFYDGGKFYLNGGSITGNNAGTETTTGNGGGVYINSGTLYINGGSITDNTSTGNGGGIYSADRIILTGGLIEGNTAPSNGKGVFHNGDNDGFEMSGSVVVAPDNDVYLSDKYKTITITGELTGGDTVATITLNTTNGYTADTAILTNGVGDALDLATESGKFAVTPNPDGGTQWFINTEGKLQEGACVSDFASLENAVASGGLVYIASNIDISETLEIKTEVTLLSRTQSVVLTGLNPGNLFTVSTGGKLIIGDADHAITLDGNKKSSQIISVDDRGIVTLANGTITNAYASGVYINAGGTFNMSGGSITGNVATNGGGVYVDANGTFDMSGGSIEANTATNGGGGVYVNTGATFTMSGSAIVTEDNDVYLSEGTTISVSADLSGDPVARITPHSYDFNTGDGVSVLSGSGSIIGSNCGRFTVTSDSYDQKYQIGSNGKLGIGI